MICGICKVNMRCGTTYEKGENNRKRFDECPLCHNRKYNNSVNFQEFLVKESNKKIIV